MSTLRGLWLLTGALLRRLSREGMVVRSLSFPTAITAGTLVLTVAIAAYLSGSPLVVIEADAAADIQAELESHGFRVEVSDDPVARVQAYEAWGAIAGDEVWLGGGGPHAMVLESVARERLGAPWRPDSHVPRPSFAIAQRMGRLIVVLLGALFSLYGVVFGAGMIARDNDSGTLEVEMSLPVPIWVHGAARLITGGVALALFWLLAELMMAAIVGLAEPAAMARHGIATGFGSTCIGMIAIGRGGLKSGFTGPLAFGMTLATSLFGFGVAFPAVGRWLPLASFLSPTSGWEALAGTAVLCVITLVVFSYRSTTQ